MTAAPPQPGEDGRENREKSSDAEASALRRTKLFRLILMTAACAGCPANGAPHTPAAAPVGRGASIQSGVRLCLLADKRLVIVEAQIDSATGDTLVGGHSHAERHPATSPPYAQGLPSFNPRERSLRVGGIHYYANHPEQTIPADLLRSYAELEGVPVFQAETPRESPPSIIYLPVRPGCVFQSFQRMSPPTGGFAAGE